MKYAVLLVAALELLGLLLIAAAAGVAAWAYVAPWAGRNDAAYATAGAVYLARTLPPVGDYDALDSVF